MSLTLLYGRGHQRYVLPMCTHTPYDAEAILATVNRLRLRGYQIYLRCADGCALSIADVETRLACEVTCREHAVVNNLVGVIRENEAWDEDTRLLEEQALLYDESDYHTHSEDDDENYEPYA